MMQPRTAQATPRRTVVENRFLSSGSYKGVASQSRVEFLIPCRSKKHQNRTAEPKTRHTVLLILSLHGCGVMDKIRLKSKKVCCDCGGRFLLVKEGPRDLTRVDAVSVAESQA